jgi:hypothetical protein
MGEFELKFTFNNLQAPLLENLLTLKCSKDPDFPVSKVESIYFENISGSAYAEKINSDYLKTKYRLRWYENPSIESLDDVSNTTVFIEKKMKYGSRRAKARESLKTDVRLLKGHDLSSPYHQSWKNHFIASGTTANIEPYLQISYLRRRFMERIEGVRVSLDSNIRVERSNLLYLPPPIIQELPVGVLEIKGDSAEIPKSLGYITSTLARKASFSKYEQCINILF